MSIAFPHTHTMYLRASATPGWTTTYPPSSFYKIQHNSFLFNLPKIADPPLLCKNYLWRQSFRTFTPPPHILSLPLGGSRSDVAQSR